MLRKSFGILCGLILIIAAFTFTGCQTAGGLGQLPSLTPAQVQQYADTGNQIIDLLAASGKIKPADAIAAKARIAQFQAEAQTAAQLVNLVNQLKQVQAVSTVTSQTLTIGK